MMQMRYLLLLAIISCASFHAAALLRGSPRSSLHDDQDLVASANPTSVEENSHQSTVNEASEHNTGDYDNDEEVPSVSVEENAPWLSDRAKKSLASAAIAGAFTAGAYYKQQDAGIGGVPAEIPREIGGVPAEIPREIGGVPAERQRTGVFNIDGNPMKEFNLLVKNDGENTRIVNVDMTHPLPKSQPLQDIISRVDSNPMKESNLLVKNEGEIPTSNQLVLKQEKEREQENEREIAEIAARENQLAEINEPRGDTNKIDNAHEYGISQFAKDLFVANIDFVSEVANIVFVVPFKALTTQDAQAEIEDKTVGGDK